MKKAVIFGIGNNYHNYEKTLHEMFDVVAMIDNDPNLHIIVVGVWGKASRYCKKYRL